MKELLTVAEYAESAHISKQAVYKAVKHPNSEIQPYVIVENGTIFIKAQALNEVNHCSTVAKPLNNGNSQVIEILREQLKAKDEQIKVLQSENSDLLQLLKNAQELQAQSNYLLLGTTQNGADQTQRSTQERTQSAPDDAETPFAVDNEELHPEQPEEEKTQQNAQAEQPKHSWLYRLFFE